MHDISAIKGLPRSEKIKIMEALWEDLSKDDQELTSPEWHADALRETEERVNAGDEKLHSWDDAKKELRKHFE